MTGHPDFMPRHVPEDALDEFIAIYEQEFKEDIKREDVSWRTISSAYTAYSHGRFRAKAGLLSGPTTPTRGFLLILTPDAEFLFKLVNSVDHLVQLLVLIDPKGSNFIPSCPQFEM
jgi:hypothetical protein